MVWYSHLFQNFPQIVVFHTVQGFSVVNEADVFLDLSCLFFMIQRMLAVWSLVSLPFLNPACTSGSSCFMSCRRLAWRVLSITLLTCKMSATVWWFEHSLQLPFFEIGMKTDLFQSCGHCWIFQIFGHIESNTLTALSLRIWNSSAGIPSLPLALFVVMLLKAQLTSHSRMSGSRWETTPSWFQVIKTFFFYVFSSYSLLLLLCPCHFCPLSCPSLHEMFPWYLWQEYTLELYQKDLTDLDNHDDAVTHLEPDILEWSVKSRGP